MLSHVHSNKFSLIISTFIRYFGGKNQPPLDKTNKMAYASSEDSDQTGHSPSLIRVIAVRSMSSKGYKLSSCAHEDSDQTGNTTNIKLLHTVQV